MPMGVKRSAEEVEAIKSKIVETLVAVPGATFYGTCQVAGVGASEAYTWRDEDPFFDAAVKAALRVTGEMALDLAESKAIKLIHNEDRAMIIFYLKTKGKDRGYTETVNTNFTGVPPQLVLQPVAVTRADIETQSNAGNVPS